MLLYCIWRDLKKSHHAGLMLWVFMLSRALKTEEYILKLSDDLYRQNTPTKAGNEEGAGFFQFTGVIL